jgi:Glycosyl transferase family 2
MEKTACTLFSPDKSFNLMPLNEHEITDSAGEIRAFILVRNEMSALPFLLSYYRNLGVTRFFFIDDHSDDGTRDYLLMQVDTHVFAPSNSFGEANSGNDWLNLLMDRFGIGYWTLVVDADELLVYPHCEKIKLNDLCSYMDREGGTALSAFLLDMYPNGDISNAICVPGKPFYEICEFFDAHYVFKKAPDMVTNNGKLFPSDRVVGGPRLRKFYSWQRRSDIFTKLFLKLIIMLSSKAHFWQSDKPHYAPALIKAPLVKWHSGCKRLSSHIVAEAKPGRVMTVTGTLLHFKFFADFHNKAKREVSRGQHYGGGQEYRRYLSYIRKNKDVSFMYEGSRKYLNSDSILGEGLIKTTDDLDQLVTQATKES